jgi:hypothetical protein
MQFSQLHRAFWVTESFIAPTNAQHLYIKKQKKFTLKYIYTLKKSLL